ncbi:1-acyl-sn-glycerol-3-phosphate acyltransferase [Marinobacter salicampi]|uniref:1-acyl-sn-glycerol-3-phosphate acyltransferase n=1 Tax=Marinobacter salicampi TaxID=435907 RepID=UPI0014096A59|nr:1-acyl-sn-glycerol-3-phosphate acyltransferase [Marinobacter salicampi]
MQEFDGIRPYQDDETKAAISRLMADAEFLEMIARFKSPFMARWAPGLTRILLQRWLRKEFGDIERIDSLQARLYHLVDELVHKTTSRVTCSGLDRLDRNTSYLFISNHRDIVFDPMVVNYLLFSYGLRTTRIAIGDNLLQNRVFAEMMRLNKSFVVKRSVSSPREMRDTYMTLSSFVYHSLEDNHSIWIAQREGRAKDGIDETDPAIVKMFYMSQKKAGLGFADAMKRLRIVPVSIAYEYDPCDADKARELETKARTGAYQKHGSEDSEQIIKGLTGFKGHVHVHFGEPITDAPDTAKELASRIDHDMHRHYHVHGSNLVAYNQLFPTDPSTVSATVDLAETLSPPELEAAEAEMERRLDGCDEALRPFLLAMYANPVVNSLKAR